MKRILITGGTGFFGKSILDYFARHESEYEFTVLSRRGLSSTSLHFYTANPPAQILGDVRSFELSRGTHFDAIIHAATPARADVPDNEMRSIIIDGTANALCQAKKCGAENFMMVSSGGTYGRGFARPASEEDEPYPVTAYGIAKLEAEKMAADSGLHVLLPRCFAFVGPYLDRNAHFAVGNFIRDALAEKDIVINGDGTPMRSYLYADDLVEWLFAILERGESGRVYNVGSPEAISIRDLAQMVLSTVQPSTSNLQPRVRILGRAVPGAANYYVPNVDRIMRELGVRVKVPLRDAILRSLVFKP